jgi:hypothetical protein
MATHATQVVPVWPWMIQPAWDSGRQQKPQRVRAYVGVPQAGGAVRATQRSADDGGACSCLSVVRRPDYGAMDIVS